MTNTTFLMHDLALLDLVDAFDVVTVFDAVHDQVQPARVLENIHRALRPGGALLMSDIKASSNLEDNIEIPLGIFVIHDFNYALHDRVTGGRRCGLGSMWGRQLATSMLIDAGFKNVEVREVETDPFNNYYIAFK